VIRQVERLADPTAMTRVDLRETARPERRETQSLLRRETEHLVWSLDIAPERSTFVTDQGVPTLDDTPLDLQALFIEYVSLHRHQKNWSEDFTALFLERGAQALTDAMLAEENPTPEDDAVS
jgi:hypothetical protein